MDLSALLITFFISIILICFLAGIEIAFIYANKLSIELSKKQGTYSGKTWGSISEQPSRFIGAILLAINIVLVIYGLLVGEMLDPIWGLVKPLFPPAAEDYFIYIRLLFETLLASSIILFLIVFSRAVFKAKHNTILNNGLFSSFARFFNWLFADISSLFIGFSEWILKYIFSIPLSEKKDMFSKIDLEHFIQQSKSFNEEDNSDINKELFENALTIGETKLRACLVPRKEIVSIAIGCSIEEAKNTFIETRLSKLVVYEGNIDNITGYIHQLDLLKKPSSVKDILLPIPTVPETMSVTSLMNKFTKERKTIAWVIDEFGGTAGVVTMEDLLEEIFGEIKDEYDEIDEQVNKQLAANEYLFSGRLELDFITEKYHLEFSDRDDTETLSGFIIQKNESIPQQKERIIVGNYEFFILSVSSTRIETVKLKVLV
jgi:putative hemolysin